MFSSPPLIWLFLVVFVLWAVGRLGLWAVGCGRLGLCSCRLLAVSYLIALCVGYLGLFSVGGQRLQFTLCGRSPVLVYFLWAVAGVRQGFSLSVWTLCRVRVLVLGGRT